jgi:Rieske Fe-S protein
LVELQKDPMTRGDFIGFGLLGTIVGAVLTIPPVAFILSPIVKTNVLGQSDVGDDWQKVANVSEVPDDEPEVFEVEFPLEQSYGTRSVQEESGVTDKRFTLTNAVWLSWKREILRPGRQGNSGAELGDSLRPAFLEGKSEDFTEQEREEIKNNLNVLSNSCAHLGCPVRWTIIEGHGEFLCPCHGGIYDINGGWVGGPPPRGMYRYTQVRIEEDGRIFVKHEYDIEPGIDGISTQQPYVV